MMLQVLIPSLSPRLMYAMEVVFTYVLGVKYQWIKIEDYLPGSEKALLDYTGGEVRAALAIPNSGFLEREKPEEVSFNLAQKELPYPFFEDTSDSNRLDFDLFSAVFYLVTEYEKQVFPRYDAHGRYDEGAYLSFLQGWHHHPLVHHYCEMLWEKLAPFLPSDYRPTRTFDYHLTFDIDNPWKYLHKGPWVTMGGMGRRLLSGAFGNLKEQIATLQSGKDPYDTFSLMYKYCPPEKTTFFFLGGGSTPFDGRFSFRQKALKARIREVEQKGYAVGLHPSYGSSEDGQMLEEESKALSAITRSPVRKSRQHFLRYRLPDTFRYLLDAGIREDYTLGLYSDCGFRTHMAVPYPWFDLEANRATSLMLHPTLAMDRTLQHYLKDSPEEGMARLRNLIEQVKSVNGVFTLLLHNDALSESDEWKGWRQPLLELIKELSQTK